ncbi:MAG: hypothetical protein NVSMB70_05050 [Chamaesiphon sp.]
MNSKALAVAFTASFFVFGLLGEQAKAASFNFSKIVDTNDLIPGNSTQKFNFNLNDIPAVNNGKVVFGTINPAASIWTANSDGTNLTKVVDTNTPIPGGSGNFNGFYGAGYQINNGTVVFLGVNNNGPIQGLYAVPSQGGAVTKVVDINDLIPGSNQKFTPFNADQNAFNVNNDTVVFSPNQQVYSVPVSGGSISVVADNNNPRGANPCCLFGLPRLSNGTVVLGHGNVFGRGALAIGNLDPKSLLTEIATGSTPTPGGSSQGLLFDNFTFSTPSINNGTVVFYAASNPASQPNNDVLQGIYSYINGTLTKLVDTNTPVPGGTGNFSIDTLGALFGNRNGIALSDGMVIFAGRDATTVQNNGNPTLYEVPATGGQVTRVIGPGDQLNGHTIDSVNFDQNSFSNGQLAIEAVYTNFQGAGIYASGSAVSVPYPENSAALGLFMLGIFLYKKRSRV